MRASPNNPLVTGPPHLRFYAGAPLVDAAGFRLGTLCLFDSTPRGLSKPGLETLEDLARIVTGQIESHVAGGIAEGPTEPVSGRKTTQERLERQELFLKSVLENLSEGVVACDETGLLILFNRSTREFHGVADDPVPPDKWAEHFSLYRADGQTLMDKSEIPLYRAFLGETIRNVEMVIAPKGKPRRVLLASGSPMYDRQRRKLGAVVLMRNVTEQIETERQLQQAQKMEAVGQLTGGLAHDFNNLLTIVIGNLQLLEQDLASDPGRARRLSAALEAANRGAKLTRQLLAFSRRGVLEPEIVNLRQHVVELEQLLKRTLGDAIDIHTSVASGTHSINVDSSLLESALLNLAINARDAMNGQGRLTVDVQNVTLDREYVARNQGLTPGDYVRISVSDTGPGMSREVLDRAFEPFFTTKGPGKGTGLGLSMVYAFAKQSKGQVKASSEPGRGTRIELYLPRATAAEIQEERRMTGRYQAIPGGSERVLVVEDNAGVRQIAVKLLQSLGYETIEAAGGWEACEILASDRNIDLLFTDIVMPGGMNGAELAQKAKALRPRLKVLFTSGYVENTIVREGQVTPGAHLLSKPYRTQELALKVRQALDEPVPEAVAH
ncbi:MAG TPA: ATP-binding protein [Gammaproteobacteria bacterium]|nr:ATP-binding protein [Gammaproteobacteria bacterium]